jgi:hypothetical protein
MARRQRSITDYEQELLLSLRALGYPQPEPEVRLIPGRRLRFDHCWRRERVALEIHGATFTGGRHTSGVGFDRDREKMALAQLAGYLVIEATAGMLRDGRALGLLTRALTLRATTEGAA